MIITIDGPAASGKGTLARRLGEHFRLPHLDTGLLYRAVGARVLADGRPLDDVAAAVAAARAVNLSDLDRDRLMRAGLGEAASRVAAMPEVRAALLGLQRGFANRPGGAVLDGRDAGTVICPDADVKLFVTATAAARAARRHKELTERGEAVTYEAVLADIRRRDERDAARAVAPLKPAPDAVLLDTTALDIEAAFQEALKIVRRV
jgi:cytidylate kinase